MATVVNPVNPVNPGNPVEAADLPVESGRLHRITHEVYEEMGRLGLIAGRDRVVLVDGLLVKKMAKNPRHTCVVENVFEILGGLGLQGYRVRKEDPIVLRGGPGGRDSEPEPDVVLARGTKATFHDRHPDAADVALLVEVADSSLVDDRRMLPVYARARIPVVWIVNLADERVEVYSAPEAGDDARYRDMLIAEEGADVAVMDQGRILGHVSVRDILA